MPQQSCRFYEQQFPEVDDVVVVNVRSIAEMGAYVNLLEYNNIEGMILLSELSRRRIRSINKLIRVGRSECVVVLRVDKEKGYIDLSKRRVSSEEIKKAEEKYNKAKTINSILRYVADVEKVDLEELYRKTAWALDKKFGGPGTSYEAFKLCVTDSDLVFDGIDLEPNVKKTLLLNIKRKLAPQPTKIRADIEVACYTYEGIDAVKRALKAGLATAVEALPIKINLIAPPVYVITATSLDKEKGIEYLNTAIAAIRESITQAGGNLHVQQEPKAVSETDEKQLAEMLEELEKKQTERPGDEDSEDDEDDEDDAAPPAADDDDGGLGEEDAAGDED